MKHNNSPWIHQLDHERKTTALSKDHIADITIVGGGIAGISTAFFTLKNTNQSVSLIEAGKIAHGATGHNAGQVTSYFERSFVDLVKEFGFVLAGEGQRAIEEAWLLLEIMYTEAKLDIPLSRFIGYDGLSTFDQIINELKQNAARSAAGLPKLQVYISESVEFSKTLPEEFKDLYELVPQTKIEELLETKENSFIGVACSQKGVINSALLCQEIARYLLETYKDRFNLFEHTRIKKVVLHDSEVLLDADKFEVKSKKVVLCTNGFEGFEIFNKSGLNINTHFHHTVNGIVARMSGYLEPLTKPPIAISYYTKPGSGFDNMEDPYFYMTRREYEYEKGTKHNLICVGGPQHGIADREEYLYDFEYSDNVPKEIDEFIKKLCNKEEKIDYVFSWHGLMGYTTNGVRLIGIEPKNPVLLYNLGCNGVGILPSIFGGERISKILNGETLSPSIFDPKDY